MMKVSLKFSAAAGAASVALLLTACGGGGGGGTPTEQPATVSLAGVAAKGILKGAQATAFEFKNNAWVQVAQVTTGTDGSYSFTRLSPTSNPVQVEIEVIAGTKMLDESQVENGAYKEIDAPTGLTIRTLVEKLEGSRANINANPFTEMAVQAALTAKDENGALLPPSSSTWAAARAQVMTLLPAGVTPESIKPLSPGETPTTEQAAVMTLLTGLAASNNIVAALGEMKSAFSVVINQTTGTVSVPQASGQPTIQDRLVALNAAGNAKLEELAIANPSLTFSSFKDNTDYNAKTFSAKNLSVEEDRASLATFVETMKVGFEATDGKVSKLGKAFDERVAPLVFDLANDVLESASTALNEVDVDFATDGSLSLTQTCGQACQFTFTKAADGSYTVAPKNTQSINGSAKMTGSQSADNSAKFSYSGSATSLSTGKKVMDFSLTISTTDLAELDAGSGVLAIENVSVIAFDDAGEKSASLLISDATLTASNNGDNVALEGKVSLTTSMGDELSGTLATTSVGAEDPYGYYEDVPLTLKATLAGKLDSASIVSINVEATNTTATVDYFNDDRQTGVIALTIKFLGDSSGSDVTASLTLTETLEKASSKGFLTVAGNTINVEEDDADSPQGKVSLTSSTGEFKLVLDDDENGDLFKGSTKIGEVKKGVLYYDNVQQSLF